MIVTLNILMDEKTQSKVKKILRKFEDKVNKQIKKKEEENQNQERLRREFTRVKEDVIRPTMEEMGKYVKELGYDYHILESDFSITFEIIPLTLDISLPNNPGISIKNWSTGIEISKRRLSYRTYAEKEKVQVEEISKHFVEQKILNALKDWEKDFSKMMRRQKMRSSFYFLRFFKR